MAAITPQSACGTHNTRSVSLCPTASMVSTIAQSRLLIAIFRLWPLVLWVVTTSERCIIWAIVFSIVLDACAFNNQLHAKIFTLMDILTIACNWNRNYIVLIIQFNDTFRSTYCAIQRSISRVIPYICFKLVWLCSASLELVFAYSMLCWTLCIYIMCM